MHADKRRLYFPAAHEMHLENSELKINKMHRTSDENGFQNIFRFKLG